MTMKIVDFRLYLKNKSAVNSKSGCWEWQGTRNALGYGMIGKVGGFQLAHRLSFHTLKGRIPKGLCVLHKCDNSRCINPKHLYVGTRKDNSRDRQLRNPESYKKLVRAICKRGHKRTPDNLYSDNSCKQCKEITNAAHWKKYGRPERKHAPR